ncbi:uncharacterized protein [Gossypium hirsutum]|uniref:Retrotransposon gag domain-containing protein n=1 Tax=Gossypium hirsutum TaxID=3635 RepID=A0ABM2ZDE0_GOSHI|nr:uncharacterized protein LOC121212309 [Gossypium hirsutum]
MADLNCTPEQKLKGAVSLLRDEAYQWWLTVKEGTQADRLASEFFKTTFQAKYVDASYVDASRREFLNLTQGDRTMAEYEAEFLRLSHYARGMVDFAALVDKVKIAKDVTRAERQNREKGRGKRDAEPSNSFQRFKKSPELRDQPELRPLLLLLLDRSFVLIAINAIRANVVSSHREAVVRPEVEMVWAVVVEHKAEVLVILRQGSQCWFMLHISKRTGILQMSLQVFRDVPLEIQGVIFLADLMELPFREFDLIVGMDWLVKPQVSLDCATKRVLLRIEADEGVVVIGERRNYLSNVISGLRAEKLVRKGCEAFLAYFSVSDVRDSSVKDIKTVKDFLDVFPEDLPRLPSKCEVGFRIELIPGTAPVSIVPYRVAPKKLVELKAQIQELLDRGFI